MAKRSTADTNAAARVRKRRAYDSAVRRAQAAATRARILEAASHLAVRRWDWRALTVRAVAERARVSERTIYRHFATQRQLHAALMRHLEDAIGVRYEGVTLDELGTNAAHVFKSLTSSGVPPSYVIHDPTFAESDERRRAGIMNAIRPSTANWPSQEQRMAAAMLDVLLLPFTYERLVSSWKLESTDAIRAVQWAFNVLVEAIRAGHRPLARVDVGERRASRLLRTSERSRRGARTRRDA